MPLAPGTRLGPYTIVDALGAGGMGEVHRAHDPRLGRDVALKVMPAEVAARPDRLARFEREARTVAGLSHPNIVVIHSVEEAAGLRFITMELIEGQSLDLHVTPGGLPIGRVVELGIAIAEALTAAHEKGVVHRDLKPANVMLTREGRVKVLDFGLAKLVEEDAELAATAAPSLSRDGQAVGTLPYMAPEQLRGAVVDARTDLFAFGVLLYELLTGRRPFQGASPAELSSSILRDAPPPVATLRADVPADLERLVVRCLEKLPRERAQSALDVGNELRRLRRSLDSGISQSVARPESAALASIAVLPFANRSGDPADEMFSDGLADELIDVLAKLRGLRVVARASSFQFRGREADPAEIGARLDVTTYLDGSVRRSGDRVRVSVQLIRVADRSHVWSETYDRTLEDVFAVQDEIARSVVKQLRSTLLGAASDTAVSDATRAELAAARRGRTSDAGAQRLHMQAHHLIERRTRADNSKAIEYLQQAVARDPAYAAAWAELAWAHVRAADSSWAPIDEAYAQAREAVLRALALEPDLPEAHAQLGGIQLAYDMDWRAAEASLARALESAPSSVIALRRAGVLALAQGHLELAVAHFRRACGLDPLDSGAHHSLGRALLYADRFGPAERALRKALELTPQRTVTHAVLALTLLEQGRAAEALAEAALEPDAEFRLWAVAIVQHRGKQHEASDAALAQLIAQAPADSAFQIAEVHATRGARDAAFEWLERALAQRDRGLTDARPSHALRALHGDPRWPAFLAQLGQGR